MPFSLPVLNAETATFECIFGRGCEGICCQNGRPCTDEGERQVIEENLEKFLPGMRPEAVEVVRQEGIATNRVKMGGRMLRVVKGWCVFFNQGCVLHKVGMEEGDAYKYKPYVCAIFPLHPHPNKEDAHYVRQWGYEGEAWDLFCLNPKASQRKATEALADEIALVTRWLESRQAEPPAEAETAAPKKKARKASGKKAAGKKKSRAARR